MAGEWRRVTLGEAITLQRGFDLPVQNRISGNVPIVSSSGISDYHAEAAVQGPGVVTGRYGTIGQVFLVNEDFWPLNTTLWVKDFQGNDPRFISYLLRTIDFESCSDKSSVPGVNRNDLHRIPVVLPPIDEQRRIAKVLGDLDDKIELNRKMNETLESIARALFKSWFVDFDPVRAKMEGRQPEGMDAETAALWPFKLVDSELGMIPEGWEVSEISDLAHVVGGSTPSTHAAAFWDGVHHWATPKDLSRLQFPVLLETERRVTDAGLAKITSGLLPRGTVLLSSRAPIGYLAITEIPVAINQGFIALLPNEGVSNIYLLHWLRVIHFIILSKANGSTFLEISKRDFRTIPIAAPPSSVMDAFDRIAGNLYKQLVSNQRQSMIISSHRDELLPLLVSGNLDRIYSL